uniref:PX domain-containing protein n=1 Tax=Caenorhabditis tropicalis TaxID=1561998 RepID=A0A1I7TPK8_9PELO
MLGSSQTTPPNAKDSYVLKLETKAIPALLDLFSSQGRQKIGISSTFLPESILSRDEDLLAYVGKCFTTRREFLRRRTYLFRVVKSEFIVLQHPYVYEAVYKLNSYLLRRGGVTSFDTLFDYYINGDIPKEVRDHNGKLRENLLAILNNHNYIFAMFPGDSYVSSRRNLPNFDYLGFLKKNFPEMLPQSPRVMPEGCTCQCHSSKKVPTFQSPAFEALKLHLDTVTQETHKKLEDVQSNFENILLGKDQNIRDLEEELAHFETHSSDFQNKAAFHKVSRELEATRRQMQEMEARHQLEIAAIKRNNSELTKSVYETVVKLRLGSQPSEEESGSDSSWSRLSGSNSIEQDD